jgi:ferritin
MPGQGLNATVSSQGANAVGDKTMPWEKRKNGNKVCVFKKGADAPLHCYPNSDQGEKDADRYLAALYMHSKDTDGMKTAAEVDIELVDALQIQMNKERQNGAVYDALAGAFEYMNLSGFARFMAKNGDEERGHAKLFFDYLADIGEQPRIDALEPFALVLTGDAYADALTMFEQALEAEKANKQALYVVNDTAESDDAATEAFMMPILLEQIKSIREFEEHVTWLTLAKGDAAALLTYDEKLGGD